MDMTSVEGAGYAAGEPEPEFVTAPNHWPDSPANENVRLAVPVTLDVSEAFTRWADSGGQVRTFSGAGPVRLKTYRFADWLVECAGAQRLY